MLWFALQLTQIISARPRTGVFSRLWPQEVGRARENTHITTLSHRQHQQKPQHRFHQQRQQLMTPSLPLQHHISRGASPVVGSLDSLLPPSPCSLRPGPAAGSEEPLRLSATNIGPQTISAQQNPSLKWMFSNLSGRLHEDTIFGLKTPWFWDNMKEKLAETMTPVSSRATSFLIDNLLGKRRSGRESQSGEDLREVRAETLSSHRTQKAQAPVHLHGWSSRSGAAHRESELQRCHRGRAPSSRTHGKTCVCYVLLKWKMKRSKLNRFYFDLTWIMNRLMEKNTSRLNITPACDFMETLDSRRGRLYRADLSTWFYLKDLRAAFPLYWLRSDHGCLRCLLSEGTLGGRWWAGGHTWVVDRVHCWAACMDRTSFV